MTQNLIACRPGCYGKYEQEAFRHMPTIGIRHVELPVPPREGWEKLRIELGEYGLKVSSVGGAVNLAERTATETFSHLADGAAFFGAHVVFLSVKSGGLSKPKAYNRLRELGDLARERGTTIALETHPDLVTNGEEAARTMQGTSHASVKLNYDSANLYYYNEGVDGIAELKKFLPWLAAVHLKETNGGYKTWHFPGLHQDGGIVDFPEIFRICEEIGFRGPFTLEIEGIEGETLSREQTLARMEQTAAYLRTLGVLA